MPFKGDFRKLGEFIEKIGRVAKGDFVKRSAGELGRTALGLAQRGASAARTPTGRAWKPLKSGSGTPLAKAASAFTLTTYDGGFRIGSSLYWLFFHQAGAKKVVRAAGFRRVMKAGALTIRRMSAKVGWRLPARRMLPTGSLPSAWSEPMMHTVSAEWEKLWR